MTDRMCDLLDAVHAALVRAEYQELDALTDAVAAGLPAVEGSRDRAGLIRVQQKAARNAVCLLATQRGFRAALRRVEEIRVARTGLVTYDPHGRRSEPALAGRLRERF